LPSERIFFEATWVLLRQAHPGAHHARRKNDAFPG
jgi:hypothetical protein